MATCSGRTFEKDKIMAELVNLIHENVGVCKYEVSRKVSVDEVVTVSVNLEMFWDKDGKKIIV